MEGDEEEELWWDGENTCIEERRKCKRVEDGNFCALSVIRSA